MKRSDLLRAMTIVLVIAVCCSGCHNLYPEDVTSLHSTDQQLLAAYSSSDPEIRAAHERAAYCNVEAVERRHDAGQLATVLVVCQPERK